MTTIQIVLITIIVFSMFGTIMEIGKPREPITANIAAFATLISLVLIYGIIHWL